MYRAHIAPQVSHADISNGETFTIANGESVIVHGIHISPEGFLTLRLEDGEGNSLFDNNDPWLFLSGANLLLIDGPLLFDNGLQFVAAGVATAHITVYHESGGG
jgi:hypothetical protein